MELSEQQKYNNDVVEKIRVANFFNSFLKGDFYPIFKKYILDDFKNSALETFTSIEPGNVNEVIQTQLMGKIPDKIIMRMHELVQQGEMASRQINETDENEEEI